MSRHRSAILKVRSSPALNDGLQSFFNLRGGQAGNANDLISTGFAGGYGNRRTRYLQKICKEVDAGLVSFAVNRRSSESQFQSVSDNACDGIAFGSRMNFNAERGALRGVAD